MKIRLTYFPDAILLQKYNHGACVFYALSVERGLCLHSSPYFPQIVKGAQVLPYSF